MSGGEPQPDRRPLPELEIEVERVIDAQAPSRPGDIGYHYDYVIYRFRLDGCELLARSYADTAERVSLLNLRIAGAVRALSLEDLSAPLLRLAIAHLRGLGKLEVCWFDAGQGSYRACEPPTGDMPVAH